MHGEAVSYFTVTCGKCWQTPCTCAFQRVANAGQDAAYKRTEFRDALIPVLKRIGTTIHLDEYMRAYDAVHAPKPKTYSCTNCNGAFTTATQQPSICPFCQQARLTTKE